MNTTWIFETSLWKPMRGITDPHLCFAAVYAPSTPLQTAPLTCSLSLLLHCSVVRYPAFVLSSFVLLSPSPDLNIQAVISLLLTINRYASMYDSTSQTTLTHLDYYTHAHSILYSFIIILLFFLFALSVWRTLLWTDLNKSRRKRGNKLHVMTVPGSSSTTAPISHFINSTAH